MKYRLENAISVALAETYKERYARFSQSTQRIADCGAIDPVLTADDVASVERAEETLRALREERRKQVALDESRRAFKRARQFFESSSINVSQGRSRKEIEVFKRIDFSKVRPGGWSCYPYW